MVLVSVWIRLGCTALASTQSKTDHNNIENNQENANDDSCPQSCHQEDVHIGKNTNDNRKDVIDDDAKGFVMYSSNSSHGLQRHIYTELKSRQGKAP